MKKKQILLTDIYFLISPIGLIPWGIFFYISTLTFHKILDKGDLEK